MAWGLNGVYLVTAIACEGQEIELIALLMVAVLAQIRERFRALSHLFLRIYLSTYLPVCFVFMFEEAERKQQAADSFSFKLGFCLLSPLWCRLYIGRRLQETSRAST